MGVIRRLQDIKKKKKVLISDIKKGKFSKHPYVHQHFDLFGLPMPFFGEPFQSKLQMSEAFVLHHEAQKIRMFPYRNRMPLSHQTNTKFISDSPRCPPRVSCLLYLCFFLDKTKLIFISYIWLLCLLHFFSFIVLFYFEIILNLKY